MKAEKFLEICRKWCPDGAIVGSGHFCSCNDITSRIFNGVFYSRGKAYFCSAAVYRHAMECGTGGIKVGTRSLRQFELDFKTYEVREVCFLMDIGGHALLFEDCEFPDYWQEEDWMLRMSFTGMEPIDLGPMVELTDAAACDEAEAVRVKALPDGLSCSKRGRAIRKDLRACYRFMMMPLMAKHRIPS